MNHRSVEWINSGSCCDLGIFVVMRALFSDIVLDSGESSDASFFRERVAKELPRQIPVVRKKRLQKQIDVPPFGGRIGNHSAQLFNLVVERSLEGGVLPLELKDPFSLISSLRFQR